MEKNNYGKQKVKCRYFIIPIKVLYQLENQKLLLVH